MLVESKEIHGIPIIPKDGFGEFEGLIITSAFTFGDIEIIRTKKTDTGYYIVSSFSVDFKELLNHSHSGKDKMDFLVSEAKKHSTENENIAITDWLAMHIELLDASHERVSQAINQN